MRAMIFAAGLGTRLKPITDTLPKALVPIAGQPLLEHTLTKLEKAGYNKIVINVHHFADQVEAYLSERDGLAKVLISDERDFLRETGGGIRHAEPLLKSPANLSIGQNTPYFLVHNVDILSNLDLSWFRQDIQKDALAVLLVSERETSRYLLFDPQSMRLVGWTNIKTGEIKSPYPNLAINKCKKLAFSGIHLISDDVFPLMKSYPEKFSIIDFYLSLADKYPIYGKNADGLKMIDVGKLNSLDQAEAFVRGGSL